jgi:hypothetical protein
MLVSVRGREGRAQFYCTRISSEAAVKYSRIQIDVPRNRFLCISRHRRPSRLEVNNGSHVSGEQCRHSYLILCVNLLSVYQHSAVIYAAHKNLRKSENKSIESTLFLNTYSN